MQAARLRLDEIEPLASSLSGIAARLATAVQVVVRKRHTDRTSRGKRALLESLDEVRRRVGEAERLGGTIACFKPVRIEFRAVRADRPVHVTWVDGPRPRFVWRAEDLRTQGSKRPQPVRADWLHALARDLGLDTTSGLQPAPV